MNAEADGGHSSPSNVHETEVDIEGGESVLEAPDVRNEDTVYLPEGSGLEQTVASSFPSRAVTTSSNGNQSSFPQSDIHGEISSDLQRRADRAVDNGEQTPGRQVSSQNLAPSVETGPNATVGKSGAVDRSTISTFASKCPQRSGQDDTKTRQSQR